MDGGFITLHRKILDWEWYGVDYMLPFFVHILFMANFRDKKWKGCVIPRGSFITSVKHLSEESGVTVRQCRTGLMRLQSTGELTIKTTNKYTMITVVNYNAYQLEPDYFDKQNDKQMTNKRQQLNKGNNEILLQERNTYPKEWYDEVKSSYTLITKRTPVGSEWGNFNKICHDLFDNGRTVNDIIGCMKYCQSKFTDWTINAVPKHMPTYLNKSKSVIDKLKEAKK